MKIRICERCKTKYIIKTKKVLWCPADSGILWKRKDSAIKPIKVQTI